MHYQQCCLENVFLKVYFSSLFSESGLMWCSSSSGSGVLQPPAKWTFSGSGLEEEGQPQPKDTTVSS